MERINNNIINANIKLVDENKELKEEIEKLNNELREIYTKAIDTSITSLDLREYIINNLERYDERIEIL